MSDETTTEYKQFDDRRLDMQTLFGRMDTDQNLYYLKEYKMMRLAPRQSEQMPDVSNVTLNDPLVYIQKAIAIIAGATRQTVVEGRKLTPKQITTVEDFLDDYFYMVDATLPGREKPGLDAFINEQIALRGRIGARICAAYDKEGGLTCGLDPFDTRCYADDTDGERVVWGATWVNKSKDQCEREYSKPGDRPFTASGSELEAVDYWNADENIVFLDKQIVRAQPNTYKYPPFVYKICPLGSFLSTDTGKKHQGESLLWGNRELWEEKNRVASILMTMTVKALFGALQYPNPQGYGAPKPKDSPYEPKTVHPVPMGAGYSQIPFSDMKAATRLLYSVLESSLQRASLSAIDYGTLTFPLSNIAITQLTSSRNDVFASRVQALAQFYQALSRMAIDQCIALGESFEIGQPGNKRSYKKSDLDGDFSIGFQFYTMSPEQMIANLTSAGAARGFMSEHTIRKDILRLQDPDGEGIKAKAEQAERTDEVLFLFNRGEALLEEKDGQKPDVADIIQAKILKERAFTILDQRHALGKMSPIEGQQAPTEAPKPALPMTSEGAGGGARPPTQGVPPEPEEGEKEGELER